MAQGHTALARLRRSLKFPSTVLLPQDVVPQASVRSGTAPAMPPGPRIRQDGIDVHNHHDDERPHPYGPRPGEAPIGLLDLLDRHLARATLDWSVLARYLLLLGVIAAVLLTVGNDLAGAVKEVPAPVINTLAVTGAAGTGAAVGRQRLNRRRTQRAADANAVTAAACTATDEEKAASENK